MPVDIFAADKSNPLLTVDSLIGADLRNLDQVPRPLPAVPAVVGRWPSFEYFSEQP